METQTDIIQNYETFNMQYIEHPQYLIHEDLQQNSSPVNVSFPHSQNSISISLLRPEMIQSQHNSPLGIRSQHKVDETLLSNESIPLQADMRDESMQLQDLFGSYRDPFSDFNEEPLMKLTNDSSSDDITSFFPRISTDLTSEEKRRPAPLNLVDVSLYPTPDSATFPATDKQSTISSDASVSPGSALHSPLSAKSDYFQVRNNSVSSVSSPLSLSHSKISKPPTKSRTKSLPAIPKVLKTGSHTTQPGPIPASKPTVKFDRKTGDEFLTFSYSKQKIIKTFTIKCPATSINIKNMPEQFLVENCVYPRAMVPIEEYKGNRGKYERECNEIGWTLCWYNPEIRNHRGLVQRAVDSWRNTRSDRALRSRRVRKGDQSK